MFEQRWEKETQTIDGFLIRDNMPKGWELVMQLK